MILDTAFLIAVDRGDERARSYLTGSRRRGRQLHTTHPVLAQVWRNGGRQARLAVALRWLELHPFDEGRAVGELLAAAGTTDVVDAHLAVLARRLGVGVLTGNVDDLRVLAAAMGPAAPRVYRWPPE